MFYNKYKNELLELRKEHINLHNRTHKMLIEIEDLKNQLNLAKKEVTEILAQEEEEGPLTETSQNLKLVEALNIALLKAYRDPDVLLEHVFRLIDTEESTAAKK